MGNSQSNHIQNNESQDSEIVDINLLHLLTHAYGNFAETHAILIDKGHTHLVDLFKTASRDTNHTLVEWGLTYEVVEHEGDTLATIYPSKQEAVTSGVPINIYELKL